ARRGLPSAQRTLLSSRNHFPLSLAPFALSASCTRSFGSEASNFSGTRQCRVRTRPWRHQDVQDEKPWETVILDDFAQLRKAELANPLMDEIETQFAAGG